MSAAAAQANIVLHRSIQGVSIGMSSSSVRERLGAPDRTVRLAARDDSYARRRWTYARERLRVELGDVYGYTQVVAVHTTSPSQRTKQRLGVGSTETALRRALNGLMCVGPALRRNCVVYRPRSPDMRTLFALESGRVKRVRIDIRPAPA